MRADSFCGLTASFGAFQRLGEQGVAYMALLHGGLVLAVAASVLWNVLTSKKRQK